MPKDLSGKFVLMLPGAVMVLIFLLVNIDMPGIQITRTPPVLMSLVFYWALMAPNMLPKWLIVLLGLITDVLTGSTLGVTSVLLLVLWGVIAMQRSHLTRESFVIIWLVYAVFLLGWLISEWLSFVFLSGAGMQLPDEGILWRFVAGICFYPVLHLICEGVRGRVSVRLGQQDA